MGGFKHARRARQGPLFLLLIAAFVLVPGVAARAANVVPPGFDDAKVADAAGVTDIAFTPDGRMLIAHVDGVISIRREDGTLVNDLALNLRSSVCATQDRGFQSVAVDPSFATNHYMYIYYTSNTNGTCADYRYVDGPVNRLSRFVLADNNQVDPLEEVLVDNIPSTWFHQGGDTEFGKDGYLYVTVGDGGCDALGRCGSANTAPRDTNTLLGKVLRLTAPNGGIPPDNPYTGSNSARCNLTGSTDPGKFCQETYASGLRNPWKFAFDPDAPGTRFFINDVGETTWEEIDLGEAGADYGWNVREGPCATNSATNCGPPPVGMTNPIHSYDHSAGCKAITGGAFVPLGAWRFEDDGAYLYGEFTCGKIFELTAAAGGGFNASELLSGMGPNSITAMTFGPYAGNQALYYSSWSTNEIRRLALLPPQSVTTESSDSGETSARVTGHINDFARACWVDYGTTSSYDQRATTACTGTTVVELTALRPGTTYHYRFAAQNGAGIGYGQDLSFTTLGADLSLTKSDSPDPAVRGQLLTYTITAGNDGPSTATGVVLTDTLPAGVSFDSASTSQGSCSQDSGTITCGLGTLATGTSAIVTIRVRLQIEGRITNTASVSRSEADPNSQNDQATEQTTVNPPLVPPSLGSTPPTSTKKATLPQFGFVADQSLGRVLRRGLRLRVSLPGPCLCGVRADVLLARKAATRLGIARSTYALLGRSSARERSGVARLTVKLKAGAKRKLRRTRRVAIVVRLTVTDATGHRSVVKHSLRLER